MRFLASAKSRASSTRLFLVFAPLSLNDTKVGGLEKGPTVYAVSTGFSRSLDATNSLRPACSQARMLSRH